MISGPLALRLFRKQSVYCRVVCGGVAENRNNSIALARLLKTQPVSCEIALPRVIVLQYNLSSIFVIAVLLAVLRMREIRVHPLSRHTKDVKDNTSQKQS